MLACCAKKYSGGIRIMVRTKPLLNVSAQEKIDALKDWIGMEDRFARIVFRDKNLFQMLLDLILDELQLRRLEVYDYSTQYDLPNLVGKSNVLDIMANFQEGCPINMEFENSDSRSSIERAIYHAGHIWSYIVNKKTEPADVRDTYIVFVARRKNAKSHKLVEELKFTFGNDIISSKLHIIYVNANAKDVTTKLGKFIHDLNEPDPQKMYIKEYADRVAQLKNMKGDLDDMSAINDALNPVFIAGQKEAIKKTLVKGVLTAEQVVDVFEVSREFVEEIQKEINEENK